MLVESQQLGSIEVPEEAVISFPFGIPGFPAARQFCLVEVKPESRFKLLQSMERADLAFVVTDPLLEDQGYPLEMVQRLATPIGMDPDEPLAVAVIVTVPPPPATPTANLLAPLAMGLKSRVGVQVVLHETNYQMRHPISK